MEGDSLAGLMVTFINMPLRESAKPNTPPEGPGIMAAVLRRYGAEVWIIDLNGYRVQDEVARAEGKANGRHLTYAETENLLTLHFNQRGNQDVIALSGMITTLRWQEAVARMIRKLQPGCFLVTGGGLGTEIRTGLFNWIPELDAVAHSEGDETIVTIARNVKVIKEKGIEQAIRAGLLSPYYAGEILGKRRFVYAGDRPRDLDALPFAAWDLLESDPYGHNMLEDYIAVPVWGGAANNSSATSFTMKRSLTTVSSRGCPYSCAFCYRGAQGERNYGIRSAEHLARQMREYIDKYGVDFIGFPDDNFAISKKRIADLSEVFDAHGVRIRWGTHARLDEADERMIGMAKAGCVYIGFGAESASAPVLTRMNKGGFILRNGIVPTKINGATYEFPATMVNGVKNCKEVGIHANCTWIMGYPGETLHDLKTSVAFILWQKDIMTRGLAPGSREYEVALASVNRRMFTATAYPGTAMFNDPEARALLTENFGIRFDAVGEPVCDDALYQYVLELDDATKVMHNSEGRPLNFSAMSTDQFLLAREYVDKGQIEKILYMCN